MSKTPSTKRPVTKKSSSKRSTRKSATSTRNFQVAPNVWPLMILGILAVGVIAVVIITHLVSKKDNFSLVPGQTHHSTGLAMTAVYPKGWSIEDKSKITDLISSLYATNGKGINDSSADSLISVAREPVDGDLNKIGQELMTLDSSDKADNTKILKQADITIGGLDAKERETTSTSGHEELIIAVDKNQIGYIISIQTPESKWQSLQPVLQTFVHTIEFDK